MKDLTHLLGKKFKTGHTPPRAARVVCVDVDNKELPIAAAIRMPDGSEGLFSLTNELKFLIHQESDYDLTEVTPYDDFNIDDKVIVWDTGGDDYKQRAHYAGIDEDGRPMTFLGGRDQWSSKGFDQAWDNCIKFEEDKQA